MAIEKCTCLGEGGNLLYPNCVALFGDAESHIITEMSAKDGTTKRYDISDATAFGTTFKDDFFNTDNSKRNFAITGLRNLDFPQEETQFVTDNTGQKEFLRNGTLSASAEAWNRNNVYASKINSHRCKRNGDFVATDKGIWGVKVSDYAAGTHYWYPVPITGLDAQWMPKKPGQDIEKVMVKFDFDNRIEIGELWLMSYSDLGFTAEDLQYYGLLDVNFEEVTAPSQSLGTTTAEFRLISDYGTGFNDVQNVDDLVAADFVVENVTTGLAVAGLVVTEVDGDKYTFAYTTETAGNTIKISMASSETNKYEGSVSYAEPA